MSIPVTLYRLDTGRTHKIQVPPYMVLRCRTVERLHAGLGFRPPMMEWNRERFEPTMELGAELGVDIPQLFVHNGQLMAVEPDDEVSWREISPGSIPVKIRPALAEEIRLLRRLTESQTSDAARHVAEMLERLLPSDTCKGKS